MRDAGEAGLTLRAGRGILGDVSAACDSPRQVLLASETVYRQLTLEPGALRENFLVSGEIERFRSGQVLRIGSTVRIRLTFPCEPCAKLNHVRDGLARAVAGRRGFLGRVVEGGRVRAGDLISLDPVSLRPLPLRPRDRVFDIVACVPHGYVLSYAALVRAAGLTRSYVRVIPGFLAAAPPGTPAHRIVAADGTLPERHRADQHARLQAEGVQFSHRGSVSSSHWWNGGDYFRDERGDPQAAGSAG